MEAPVDVRNIQPIKALKGNIDLPGDPTVSVMALALASRSAGTSEVSRCSGGPEADVMVDVLRSLGVTVGQEDGRVTVTGGEFRDPGEHLDVESSGLALGCLVGLLAGGPFRTSVTGDAACRTVADRVVGALRDLGGRFAFPVDGLFPLEIAGGDLKPGRCRIGSPDPAVKSAALLAGLGIEGEVELVQDAPGDEDLEILLKASGIELDRARAEGAPGFRLALKGPAEVRPASHDLPGDAKAALYSLLTASLLKSSDLTVSGLGNDWKTRRALDLLRRMKAELEVQVTRSSSGFLTRRVRVKGSAPRCTKIAGDLAALFADEVPYLAVVGACTTGETIIRDAAALRKGSTDCIALMAENLRRMEARVGEMPDGLVVQGGRPLQGAEVDAGGDGLLTQALMLAGLVAQGETTIRNPGPIDRDFSGMFESLLQAAQGRGKPS